MHRTIVGARQASCSRGLDPSGMARGGSAAQPIGRVRTPAPALDLLRVATQLPMLRVSSESAARVPARPWIVHAAPGSAPMGLKALGHRAGHLPASLKP